jgi:hypothetical protein
MKMRIDIVIDADMETVWRSFDNPEYMKKWQPMIETVTERREPDFIAGTRESAMGKTVIVNHFAALGDGQTRWSMYANHTFGGIYKLLGIFFAGSIRKRNEEIMDNFKLYTETVEAERAQ